MDRYLSLLPFLAVVAITAITGGTFRPGEWYENLAKPSWTPPGWLFGPAWAILYVMIAVAGWLVWKAAGWGPALAIWIVQLLLNGAWSWIMFGERKIGLAAIDVGAMWLMIAAFIVAAWPVSQMAALLFVPYLAWVSFAAALNVTIWRLN